MNGKMIKARTGREIARIGDFSLRRHKYEDMTLVWVVTA